MQTSLISSTEEVLTELLAQRILVLDGAMGTTIQGYGLNEEDFRGSRFRTHSKPLKGCNDLLVLTQPQIIENIHRHMGRKPLREAVLDGAAQIATRLSRQLSPPRER